MLTGKAKEAFIKWYWSGRFIDPTITENYRNAQEYADSKGIQMYLTPTTNLKWTFSIFDNNTGEGVTNEMRGTLEETMTAAVKRLDSIINGV